jgi:hypothetical protein
MNNGLLCCLDGRFINILVEMRIFYNQNLIHIFTIIILILDKGILHIQ